nr:DUF4345 domain-containing protein [Mycolicibacterium fluoranthenivorans]
MTKQEVTVVELVVALFFAGMGLYALTAPATMVRPFGVTLATATARAEVRAVYGGFGVAIAAVLVYASRVPEARTGVLITVGVALAGMAVGRVVSVFDGRTPFYPNWFYCLVEAVAAAALFGAV